MGLSAKIVQNTLPQVRTAIETWARTTAPKVAAPVLIGQIKKRTADGKDVDGSAFIPYTDKYKKYKESKYGNADTVNLRAGGTMLDSLDYYSSISIGGGSAGPGIAFSSEENAKAAGNQSRRKFVGVGIEDFPLVLEAVVGSFNNIKL